MATFEVQRKIDGLTFQRDEDRIKASSWGEAELKLLKGRITGRYDRSCKLFGCVKYEVNFSLAKWFGCN